MIEKIKNKLSDEKFRKTLVWVLALIFIGVLGFYGGRYYERKMFRDRMFTQRTGQNGSPMGNTRMFNNQGPNGASGSNRGF